MTESAITFNDLRTVVLSDRGIETTTKANCIRTLNRISSTVSSPLLGRETVQEFADCLIKQGLAPSTIRTYVANLKIACRRHPLVNEVELFRYVNIEKVRASVSLDKSLPLDSVISVYDTIQAVPRINTRLRDTCILLLLLSTGMRRSSLHGLSWPNFSTDYTYATIRIKGGTMHQVPLWPRIIPHVKAWRDWTSQHSSSQYVALSESPGRRLQRVSYSGLQGLFQPYAASDEVLNLHRFRHTFITRAHVNGWTNMQIATVTGHAKASAIPLTYFSTEEISKTLKFDSLYPGLQLDS